MTARQHQNGPSRIPVFKSRDEEAAWWDTHDITDYLDELKPVQVRFARNLSEGLTVRLDPDTMYDLNVDLSPPGC